MKSRVSIDTLINLKKDFFRQQTKHDIQLLAEELIIIIRELENSITNLP